MSFQSCVFLNTQRANPNEYLLTLCIKPLVRKTKNLPQMTPTVLFNPETTTLYCFKNSFSHKLLTLREIPIKEKGNKVLIEVPDIVGYVKDCYKQFKEDTKDEICSFGYREHRLQVSQKN